MSLQKLEASLVFDLNGDQHCISAVEMLLKEVPYEKMGFMGRFIFQKLLKSSLYRRKQYLRFKKTNINRLQLIQVEKPIFITGLPRSGTTLLQNLLIKYFKIEGIPFWEIIQPIPKLKHQLADKTLRKIRAYFLLTISKIFGPKIDKMHPMTLNSYEECWHLFLITFHVYNFDLQMGISNYGRWISEHSISKAYEEYAEILQIIVSLRKNHRLILKCPEHMLFTDSIDQTFSESKIIWIHRDPVKSIASYTNMIYEIRKFYFGHANKRDVAEFVSHRFYQMIEKITYAREKLSINIIDVQYKDLITNQKNTIQYLAERCRVDISILPDLIGNQNVRQLKSKVIYNSTKQEIDPDHVHRQFGDYMDRFQILKEV